MAKASLSPQRIAAIGVTNQRETTILWDRHTGRAVANAVVWQSRASAAICEQLKAEGLEATFRAKTGLLLDAYFSGTKIKYLLDSHEGLRRRAQNGDILFGTVDTWLLWRLTGGKRHVTDLSNASRTLIFNIHTLDWDDELLAACDIPRAMLPEVLSSSEIYGQTDSSWLGGPIPIASDVGDQQAAAFGQMCFQPGSAKNTYGTGCFLLLNTGSSPVVSRHRLLTTIGWGLGGRITYCLEGSIFIGGAVVQWLRDGLGVLASSADVESLAAQVSDSGGVCFVPAFVGLGAPYWELDREYRPALASAEREALVARWRKAVGRSLDWASRSP
jgi:glycerol kinase